MSVLSQVTTRRAILEKRLADQLEDERLALRQPPEPVVAEVIGLVLGSAQGRGAVRTAPLGR